MLWVCGKCGTRYAVGLPYCPQCTSTDYRPEGEEEQVPKNTVHGGPSNADEPAAPTPAAAAEAPAAPAEPAEDEGDGYEALTVEQLRDALDARGLGYASRDRKDDLVARLRAEDAAAAAEAEALE